MIEIINRVFVTYFFNSLIDFSKSMIEEKLLLEKGATLRKYKKDQSIFYEGDKAMYYFQIAEGSIKMVSVNDTGKEFIQGIFKAGESFGEPVLIIDEPYPATAVANEDSIIIKLNKESFLDILKENPDIHFHFSQVLAKRIYHKSLIAKEISTYGPEHRIFSVLNIFKKDSNLNGEAYKVQLSRQQIADMTGLRVETVIRSIKKLQEKKLIKIQKGKIYM
jgi:CRP/FNR family transcriptional regulator, cyclic AMP receptor protein